MRYRRHYRRYNRYHRYRPENPEQGFQLHDNPVYVKKPTKKEQSNEFLYGIGIIVILILIYNYVGLSFLSGVIGWSVFFTAALFLIMAGGGKRR